MKAKNNFIILLASTVIVLIFLGLVVLNTNQTQPKVEGTFTSWLFGGLKIKNSTPRPVVVSNSEIDKLFTELDTDAKNLDNSLNDKAIDVMGQ